MCISDAYTRVIIIKTYTNEQLLKYYKIKTVKLRKKKNVYRNDMTHDCI